MISKEQFITTYSKHAAHQFATNPNYAYSAARNTPEELAEKMYTSLMRGSANKEGAIMKATLKEFGIKNTYKAIREALGVTISGAA